MQEKRIIKFRVWLETTKEMYYQDQNTASEMMGLKRFAEIVGSQKGYTPNIMQFTGLLDKNGKEIYEGDVVRMLYTDWPSQSPNKEGKYEFSTDEYMKKISKLGVVIYSGDRFSLKFKSDKYGEFLDSMYEGTHGQKEVIGNIYENPDLLTLTKK